MTSAQTRARGVGRSWGGERGSGTILVLAVVPLIVAATAVVIAGAALVAVRHRAAVAADLAALAAAQELANASGDPCASAGRIALANDAALDACTVVGTEVEVSVSIDVRGWAAAVLPEIARRARAGVSSAPSDLVTAR